MSLEKEVQSTVEFLKELGFDSFLRATAKLILGGYEEGKWYPLPRDSWGRVVDIANQLILDHNYELSSDSRGDVSLSGIKGSRIYFHLGPYFFEVRHSLGEDLLVTDPTPNFWEMELNQLELNDIREINFRPIYIPPELE